MADEFSNRNSDVSCDLPEKRSRNVSPLVHRDGCAAAIRMAIWNVESALTNGVKAERLENAANLAGLKNRNIAHS